jgi:hypothetical protein
MGPLGKRGGSSVGKGRKDGTLSGKKRIVGLCQFRTDGLVPASKY